MRVTYTSDTDSLSFWPIYHRQSTDIPSTINGQRIGWVSTAIWTEISANSRSICRPSLGRHLGWYIGRYVDWHISVHISTNTRPICRPTYTWPICRPTHRSSVGRYHDWDVDRYISWGVHKIHMIQKGYSLHFVFKYHFSFFQCYMPICCTIITKQGTDMSP